MQLEVMMSAISLERRICEAVADLAAEQQQDVLTFVQSLRHSSIPGVSLLHFAGSIEPSDLSQMAAAIQQGCEKVNIDEW